MSKVELDLAETVNLLKSLASVFLEIRKDFDGYERKGLELCGLTSYKIKRNKYGNLKQTIFETTKKYSSTNVTNFVFTRFVPS
ncbi:hypothetical protein NQ314_016442 [Rhamnusium bicolor]|uniref:Uncharacterized protein n=1 Tax=Rhamnusium bicolor TaxID=1586634 RepID=A0AAV8WW94_9CUCU|nr:hypothetical protein NQ314_016442 [Rhamnusium bicolor]